MMTINEMLTSTERYCRDFGRFLYLNGVTQIDDENHAYWLLKFEKLPEVRKARKLQGKYGDWPGILLKSGV